MEEEVKLITLILFFVSLSLLNYTWWGYFIILKIIIRFIHNHIKESEYRKKHITVLLTVFNEERNIKRRLDNLIEQNFPSDLYDILVVSDGSTDQTNNIVISYIQKHNRVHLFIAEGQGKSAAQNEAIEMAEGDIVVLTDADTLFHKNALTQMEKHFSCSDVGCVSGRLVLGKTFGCVSDSQGLYWRFEMALRKIESDIGAMHTATGAIMAFRKSLFRPFDTKYGDDCIIPLDIIQQGYRVVHDDAAIAYDSFPSSIQGELRARIRMTLRNITCTLSRYQLLNPFKYPLISLAIISHKLLRWLTPFFMLAALFTNIFLLGENIFYLLSGISQGLFYILGAAGFIGELCKVRIPVASQIFSFLLANTGFFLGVLKAISGKQVTSYKNKKPCHGA